MNNRNISYIEEVENNGATLLAEVSNNSCEEYYLVRTNGTKLNIGRSDYSVVAKYAEGIKATFHKRDENGIIKTTWSK